MTTRNDLRGFLARATAVEGRHPPTSGPRVRWPAWAGHLVDHRGGIGACAECADLALTLHLAELVDGRGWADLHPQRPALDVLKARRWPRETPPVPVDPLDVELRDLVAVEAPKLDLKADLRGNLNRQAFLRDLRGQ